MPLIFLYGLHSAGRLDSPTISTPRVTYQELFTFRVWVVGTAFNEVFFIPYSLAVGIVFILEAKHCLCEAAV